MSHLSLRFVLAGALLAPLCAPPARAQLPAPVAPNDKILSVKTGERITLPYAGVSRIIVENDEIARAFFQNGSAVLEGIGSGSTTVEVYQADGTPRLLTVTVGAATALAPTNPPAIPVAPPAPVQTPGQKGGALPVTGLPTTQPSSLLPPDVAAPNALTPVAPIAAAPSQLAVSLSAAPVAGTGQALFTVKFSNPGPAASDVTIRYALDERVSYVTGSATNGGLYDAARREVVWKLGPLASGASGQATLKVEPIENARALTFESVATIEDGAGGPINSAILTYSTAVAPLLTVFALPDRFLAGQNKAAMTDVRGSEYQNAVQRLSQIGIVQGYPDGRYRPVNSTERAEYAVMTLRGLNLRDLRDGTQIKFVLGRASTVNLSVSDESGKKIASLERDIALEAGEHTVVWDGRTDAGAFAAPGRYLYSCTARDARGQSATLESAVYIVSATPLKAEGTPTFTDVKASDWYAGYLAVGEDQGLLRGFPDKSFRPRQPISRVEATAIVVRALGLSDVARQWADKNVGFEDYEQIPAWARGDVNVATMLAKTGAGQPILRGTAANTFEPNQNLRRDQAALVVQRLIDRETTRKISVSGAVAPGAVVSINSKPIEADGQGRFAFTFDLNTALPTTIFVADGRNR